jgi:tetratricopeptide (TPR) repeat protein
VKRALFLGALIASSLFAARTSRAQTSITERALAEAEAIFQQALSAEEDGPSTRSDRLFAEAESRFRAVLRLAPHESVALGRVAAILYRRGDHQKTRELLLPELRAGIATTELRWQLALAEEALGNLESALLLAEEVNDSRPTPGSFVLLGRTLLRLGRVEDAELALDRSDRLLLTSEASDARALCDLRIEIAFSREHWDKAAAIGEKCWPSSDQGREARNIATALAASGKTKQALSLLGALSKDAAADSRTKEVLAYALLADNQPASALEVLNEIGWSRADSESDPDTRARRATYAGFALERIGKTAEAEAAYRRALSRSADQIDANLGLGRILLEAGRYAEATAILARAVKRRPKDERLCSSMARALRRSGRPDEALDQLRTCAAIDPESRAPRLRLAAALLEIRAMKPEAIDEALAIYEELLAADASDATAKEGAVVALRMRARSQLMLFEQSGERSVLDGVIADLSKAKGHDESDSDLLSDLAVALIRASRAPEAELMLRDRVEASAVSRTLSPSLAALYARAANGAGEMARCSELLLPWLKARPDAPLEVRIEIAGGLISIGRAAEAAAILEPFSSGRREIMELVARLHLVEAARLVRSSDLSGAQARLQRAKELASGSPDATTMVEIYSALIGLRAGRTESSKLRELAEEAKTKEILSRADQRAPLHLLAIGELLAGNPNSAIAAASKALAIAGGAGDDELRKILGLAYLDHAIVNYRSARFGDAEKERLLAARLLGANHPGPVGLGAAIAYRRGNKEEALSSWRALESAGVAEGALGLAIHHAESDDTQGALGYFRRYVELGGSRSDVRRWISIASSFSPGKSGSK